MNLEKEASRTLGWTPMQIARASQSQIQQALKTPLPVPIVKEQVVKLDFLKSSSSSSPAPFQTPFPAQTPFPTVPVNLPKKDASQLIQHYQNIKMKYNEKLEFKTAKLVLLEKGGDLSYLERSLAKDLEEIKKTNQEITDLVNHLIAMVANKKELLNILDVEDTSSIAQIKLRIDQLTGEIDSLKAIQ